MAKIQKVTDPARVVTDPEMLRELARQNIDKDYVEFFQDYGAVHVGLSPYAKFYQDLKSGRRFMVVSGLPKVTDDGAKVVAKWLLSGGSYLSKTNLLSAAVELGKVEVKVGENKATWNPQLFLNGVEQSCGEATLLAVDPTNENYHDNVLEWDYGCCRRRLRLIHGAILERWVFSENPNGEVRIKHNQSGDLKLGLGIYQINGDEELVPAKMFDKAKYALEIGASLTVYTTSSDGRVYGYDNSYATAHSTGYGVCSAEDDLYFQNDFMDPKYAVARSFVFFVTSPLGASAVISAATLSLYGSATVATETDADHPDCGIVEGVQSDPLVTGDFANHTAKTTLGADSYYSMNSWVTNNYNDKALNATGIGWISKTGTTKFCLRAKGDIDNATPTGLNQYSCWANEKGSGYQPKLVVTYTGVTPKTSSDSGSGSETLLSRAYVLPEVGTGSEALSSRLLGAVEQGAGAETLLARLLASTESASGLDFGGLFFASSDVGSGLDAILALEAILTGADSGSGTDDIASLIKALLATDSGLGTDAVAALLVSIVTAELMVGSDRLVVKVESAPKGGGMRLPPGGKTSISSRRVNL